MLWRTATRHTGRWPWLRVCGVPPAFQRCVPLMSRTGRSGAGLSSEGSPGETRCGLARCTLPALLIAWSSPILKIVTKHKLSSQCPLDNYCSDSRACPPCFWLMCVMRPWPECPTEVGGSVPQWAHCENILCDCCPDRRILALLTLRNDAGVPAAGTSCVSWVSSGSTGAGVLTSGNCVPCFVYMGSPRVGFKSEVSFVFTGPQVSSFSQANTCVPPGCGPSESHGRSGRDTPAVHVCSRQVVHSIQKFFMTTGWFLT